MYAWQSKLNTKSISEFSPNIQILLLKKYCVSKFFSKINSQLKKFQTKWYPVKCHIFMIASMILNN